MSIETTIIDVTIDNILEHPQVICFINPKHEFYYQKADWLKEQYENGLKTKLLYLKGEKKPVGFIEYVPGEYCWRSVKAKGYMFIHCLWTNGKKHQHQGLGSILIKEVERDGKDMLGVAVVTSDKSFMTTKKIFIKNDYNIVAESGKNQLMVKQFVEGTLPTLNNQVAELAKYKNEFSKQCPWVARFIEECKPILKKEKLDVKIIELKSAIQAQKAPSVYSVFNLIYDGELLADRYISTTRFQNIIKKEISK